MHRHVAMDVEFEKLHVLMPLVGRTMRLSPLWLCRCLCRSYCVVSEFALLSGKRRDCGCVSGRRTRIFIPYDKKIGRLMLLSFTGKVDNNDEPLFLFRCSCIDNNQEHQQHGFGHIEVPLGNVLRNPPYSCGCRRVELARKMEIDIANRQFGRLRAIRKTGRKTKSGTNIWLCKCRCKKFTEASVSDLLSGHKDSCGCKKQEVLTPDSPYSIIQGGTNLAVISRNEPNALNTSGVTGVSYLPSCGKWLATLQFQNKILLRKTFVDFGDAVDARKKAEERYFKPFIEIMADKVE